MKLRIINLIQFIVSTAEHGLWWDHDKRGNEDTAADDRKKGWGFMFTLRAGTVIRHYLKPKYWIRSWKGEQFPHRWKAFDPEYHGMIRFWCPLCPFFSVALGPYGFYIGFKRARINKPEQFELMFKPEEIEKDAKVLVATASTRSTRWK
jgi:hypothetical protein